MFTIGRLDIGIRTRGAGTPPVPAAPASTSAPAITGSPLVGASLSCSTGGWTGFPAPTFTYQWIWADTSANISGATLSTYTPVSGDLGHTLKCAVTATNSQGNATANSNTSAAVVSAPVNTVAPAVTGTTTAGQTLSTTNGTWSNTPTGYAYQWKWADTGASISGATASTYLLVSGDVGHTIKCTVTATNAAGSVSADSNTTGAVTSGVVGPVFQTDFTALTSLPTGVSLSRATTATYFDASGVLQTAAINAARFDHNAATLAAKGLLGEEQRTNLLLNSGDLTAASWGGIHVAKSVSATLSPDGTAFMTQIAASAGSNPNSASVYNNASIPTVSGAPYGFSRFVKKTNYNYVFLNLQADNQGHYITVIFDLSTLAVTQTAVGPTSGTLVSTHIENVGGGIYRIGFVGSYLQTAGAYFVTGFAAAATGNTFDIWGNVVSTTAGTETLLAWGAQMEAGSFISSDIPTTSAAVTRSADILSSSSPLTAYLAAGPSVWEFQDEATGTIARTAYAAGAFDWPVNRWYRSMGVYAAGTDTSSHMTVGGAY